MFATLPHDFCITPDDFVAIHLHLVVNTVFSHLMANIKSLDRGRITVFEKANTTRCEFAFRLAFGGQQHLGG
jgi:hypothetical protein